MTRHDDQYEGGPLGVNPSFSPPYLNQKVPPSEIGPVLSLSGSEPHPGYGGWAKFLGEHCDLRRIEDGVRYFGATNCNYILFQDGMLVENYGYHGDALMNVVREDGAAAVQERVKKNNEEWQTLMRKVRAGL